MMIRFLASLLLMALLSACKGPSVKSDVSDAAGSERCVATTEREIRALFTRWNDSLQTGDPKAVVANYAKHSILLPTVSNEPRITPEQKEAYFKKFLENEPTGTINSGLIDIGCNYAIDAGLYTFKYQTNGQIVPARYSYSYRYINGTWLITSHHSSKMPEPIKP